MYTKVDQSLPVLYINDWIPGKYKWDGSPLDEATIPSLSEAIESRAYKALVLDWASRATILDHTKKTFIGTTDISRAIKRVKKVVQDMRRKWHARDLLPLIIHSWKLRNNFQWTNIVSYWDILFLVRRIVYNRLSNEREAVILAKNKNHANRMNEGWGEIRKTTKNISIRIETDVQDIIWPLQAKEFPDIISIPQSMTRKIHIGERELELREDEFESFSRAERWSRQKKRKKNTTKLIDVTHSDDESVAKLLTRLTRGKITHINIYGPWWTGTQELCHPHLDIPNAVENCLMI